jgi:hypothetical protein
MVTPLVTSLLHFHQYKLFKNMVCISALFGFLATFQKLGNLVTLVLVNIRLFMCLGSTVVQCTTHNPMIKGLNTATVAVRDKKWQKVSLCKNPCAPLAPSATILSILSYYQAGIWIFINI